MTAASAVGGDGAHGVEPHGLLLFARNSSVLEVSCTLRHHRVSRDIGTAFCPENSLRH